MGYLISEGRGIVQDIREAQWDWRVCTVEMRTEILHHMHDAVLSGHLGVKRTKERVSQRYYWYNLKQDIKWYIKRCDVCAVDKPTAKTPIAPMGHLRSGAPWRWIILDLFPGLHEEISTY